MMEATIIHNLNQPICVVKCDVELITFTNECFKRTFVQDVNDKSVTGHTFIDTFIPLTRDKAIIRDLIHSSSILSPMAEFIQVSTIDNFRLSQETDLSSIYNIHISRINENEIILLFIKQIVSLEILENKFLRSHVNAADMVHQAPLAIHAVDDKGIVIYANKRELDLMEYSANEYIGHSRMKFLPSKCDKNDHYHESIAHVGRNFEVSDMLFDWITKSGNVKQMMMSANVRYFDDDDDDDDDESINSNESSNLDDDDDDDDCSMNHNKKESSVIKINNKSNNHNQHHKEDNNSNTNQSFSPRRYYSRSFHRDDTEKVMRDTLLSLKKDLENEAALSASKDAFIRRIFHEIKTPLHIVAQEIELSYSHLHTIKDQIDTVSGTIEDLSFATAFQAIETKLIQQQADLSSSPRINNHHHHNHSHRHHSLHHQQHYLPKRSLPTSQSCEMLLANTHDYEYQNVLHMIETIIAFVKSTEIRSGQEVSFKIDVPEILRHSSVRVHTGLSRVLFHLIRNGVIYSPESNAQVSVIVSLIPHLSSPSFSSSSTRSAVSSTSSYCASSSASPSAAAAGGKVAYAPVVPIPLIFSSSSLSSPLSPSIYTNNFPPTPVANTARSALSSARFPYDTTSSTSSTFSTLNINANSSPSAAAMTNTTTTGNNNNTFVLTPNNSKYNSSMMMMTSSYPSTPSGTTATAGGGLMNGMGGNEVVHLNFKVCNTCESPLDRDDVEKCFHTYFTHEKKPSPSSPPKPSFSSSSSPSSSSSSVNPNKTATAATANNNNNNTNMNGSILNNHKTTNNATINPNTNSITTSTILENSLTSIQGKRLGLYVAYNKLKIMQSHLECIAHSNESIFTFNLYHLNVMNEMIQAQSAKFVTVANIGRILSKSRNRSTKSIKISFKDDDDDEEEEEEGEEEGGGGGKNGNGRVINNSYIGNNHGSRLHDDDDDDDDNSRSHIISSSSISNPDKSSPDSIRNSSNSSPNKHKLISNTTSNTSHNSGNNSFLSSSKGNHMPSSKTSYYSNTSTNTNSSTAAASFLINPTRPIKNDNNNNDNNNNNTTATATTTTATAVLNSLSIDSADNNRISYSNDTGNTTIEEEDFLGYSNHGVPVRVLIVDDSVPIIKAMSRLLKAKGFVVGEAHNGKYACDMLSTVPCPYDVVLMDLRMPVMDGITATKHCREVLKLYTLPIIAITAEVGHTIQEEVMKAGANACLTKPVKTSIIIETIFNLVSVQQQQLLLQEEE